MHTKIKILIILLSIGILGCSKEVMYKNKLVPRTRKAVSINPYGSYIEIKASKKQYEGEFIAIANDSLYVMTLTDLISISKNEIVSFELILTQNKSKHILAAVLISMIPALLGVLVHSDYSSEFITLGLTTGALGGLAALIESQRVATIIKYPNPVSDLSLVMKYARFPVGIPEKLDIYTLHNINQVN